MANFFFFLFVSIFSLLCCFVGYCEWDPSELVSVMERNLSYSMKILHELCESRIYKGIGKKIFEEQRDEDWRSIDDVG